MRLQSAIFDMDGTLLDSMPMWDRLGSRLVRSLGYEPAPDLDAALHTLSSAQAAEYSKNLHHMTEPVEEIVALYHRMIGDYYRREVTAKPGVERFLSILKMEGVWMYVATATDRPLALDALAHTGLLDYFRGVITCAEVGKGKGDPAVFERAMTRLQSNKRDTVVFEDSVVAIRTARAAGFRVAAVYDPVSARDEEEIRSLAEVYIESFEELSSAQSAD